MPRMNILSTGEKDEFDTPPVFNSAQRKQFFETQPDLMQEVNKLRIAKPSLLPRICSGFPMRRGSKT